MRKLVIFTSGSTEAQKKNLRLISGYSVPAVFRTFYFNYPGEGGGGTQQIFIRGGSASRSNPLPF